MKRSPQSGRKSRGSAPDLQFKLLLPRPLHDRVAAAAAESGRSVSEEIRQRLEGSFGVEADEQTRQLTEAIKLSAAATGWRQNSDAYATFRAAIDVLLRQFPPRGGATEPPDQEKVAREGAMVAGVALGALGLSFQVGVGEPTGRRTEEK